MTVSGVESYTKVLVVPVPFSYPPCRELQGWVFIVYRGWVHYDRFRLVHSVRMEVSTLVWCKSVPFCLTTLVGTVTGVSRSDKRLYSSVVRNYSISGTD